MVEGCGRACTSLQLHLHGLLATTRTSAQDCRSSKDSSSAPTCCPRSRIPSTAPGSACGNARSLVARRTKKGSVRKMKRGWRLVMRTMMTMMRRRSTLGKAAAHNPQCAPPRIPVHDDVAAAAATWCRCSWTKEKGQRISLHCSVSLWNPRREHAREKEKEK